MEQGKCLDQVLVKLQGATDGTSDGGNFLGMRESRAVVITHLAGEDLHLSTQPAVGTTVENPVAISLKRAAVRMVCFRVLTAERLLTEHRVGCEQGPFPLGRCLQPFQLEIYGIRFFKHPACFPTRDIDVLHRRFTACGSLADSHAVVASRLRGNLPVP